jgi:hypothetical protein
MALVNMFAAIFSVEMYSNWIVFAFTVTDIVMLNVYVLGLKMMNWILDEWQTPLAIGKYDSFFYRVNPRSSRKLWSHMVSLIAYDVVMYSTSIMERTITTLLFHHSKKMHSMWWIFLCLNPCPNLSHNIDKLSICPWPCTEGNSFSLQVTKSFLHTLLVVHLWSIDKLAYYSHSHSQVWSHGNYCIH